MEINELRTLILADVSVSSPKEMEDDNVAAIRNLTKFICVVSLRRLHDGHKQLSSFARMHLQIPSGLAMFYIHPRHMYNRYT
jgi:hypothetical protein